MFQFIKYFLYIIVPIFVGLTSFVYLRDVFFVPLNQNDTTKRLIEVLPDTPINTLCRQLVEEGIIKSAQSLCLFRQLSGSSAQIMPGEYELSPAMTPQDIMARLDSGERFNRSFNVAEGSNIWKIDEIIAESGILKLHDFETAATDPELLTKAGIGASSFEGYLGLGEYSFSKGVQPAVVIWDMLERAEKDQWSSRYAERIFELRMSRHEVLTLASIVHKSSTDPDERRKIASVLHNRLKNGMKLMSEEALVYAMRDFDGVLSESDKALPSPYNTFINYGLPPGPILNPGKDAIEAVLYPPESSYLFYGRRKDGTLIFATTQAEYKKEAGEE
jgi:UPF0755 protein